LRISQMCVEQVGVNGAGLSIVSTTGHRELVCSTDDVAAGIEDLQFTVGQGPGIDAVSSGAPVLISDLQQPRDLLAERWAAFLPSALATGVRGLFAFPLQIGAITLGVLDLYRSSPGALLDAQVSDALMAGEAAAMALLQLATSSADGLPDDAGSGAAYQLQVHQATGMVSVQAAVSIEDAFAMLRARAFAGNHTVAEVARAVVERRLRFAQED
jgi:hypothetical protein